MENLSSKSTKELEQLWNKMRKWKKPTHEQLMDYLQIYSELEYRTGIVSHEDK